MANKIITFEERGDFPRLRRFLQKNRNGLNYEVLHRYGQRGVEFLTNATPIDSGKTASLWSYKIEKIQNGVRLAFYNSNINEGIPIAIIIQYGHATKNGGWVEGIDYINPALRPIFNEISTKAWKEVASL